MITKLFKRKWLWAECDQGDKCFDTQEISVPHNKVKKTHNKSSKNTQSSCKTHNKVLKHTNQKHYQNITVQLFSNDIKVKKYSYRNWNLIGCVNQKYLSDLSLIS